MRSLQTKLALYILSALLPIALLSGIVVYNLTYQHSLKDAATLERQLVDTVRTQAEVAAFAANVRIAEGVIEGLRANSRIRAVRIVGQASGRFNVSAGQIVHDDKTHATDYPLFSPVEDGERIGTLTVYRNDATIQAEANLLALRQAAVLLIQISITSILILLFTAYLISRPLERLAHRIAHIKPGSSERIAIAPQHELDELGTLTRRTNELLDTTEKALAEISALATTDALTGLLNRRAFMPLLEHELERIKRYELPVSSLLMLDLDHFKLINDNHGHAAGDTVLREFARLLAEELRKVDSAGRVGGEEFAAFLPATDLNAAAIFAERLRQTVAATAIQHGPLTLYVTVSIGVAQLLSSDERPEDALARADAALYRAKGEGRNRVASAPPLPAPHFGQG